jgi:butyrate kinase
MLTGKGGMVAYLGTNNFIEICRKAVDGDERAVLIRDAFVYQVGKAIGAMASALKGKVDAIILTGGIAFQEDTVNMIKPMIEYISEIVVYPGEDEMKALSFNGLLALDGKIEIKTY